MKRILSVLLIGAMILLTGLSAVAAGEVGGEPMVYLDGAADKIIVMPEDKDLFQGFKGVYPGFSGTQEIELSNRGGEEMKLYMRSEYLNDGEYGYYESEEQQRISDELLGILQITVSYENADGVTKQIYKGEMSGMPVEAIEGSLEDWTYIGTYADGEKGKLFVTLDVPTSLGNEYQHALSVIKWVFHADIYEPAPETGDNMGIFALGGVFLLALAGIIVIAVKRKKENTAE